MIDKGNIKDRIDWELKAIKVNTLLKSRILSPNVKQHTPRRFKAAAAAIIFILVSGTTVFAGYHFLNKINVNQQTLPELDALKVVKCKNITSSNPDKSSIEKDINSYQAAQDVLGVQLLNSDLAADNNPYLLGHISKDGEDSCTITMTNFILGDTANYKYNYEINEYRYTHGHEYYSPISLSATLILSKTQLDIGWNVDYLGMYEYVESYNSTQGYKVNIVQSTNEGIPRNKKVVSEKCAIFVAKGIYYEIKGRVSIETLKTIVNSFSFH